MNEHKYVSWDPALLATYTGLGTGREVLFNSSPGKFLFLRVPDELEWRQLRHEIMQVMFRRRMVDLETFREERHILRIFDWQHAGDRGGKIGALSGPFLYLKRDWFLSVAKEFQEPPIGRYLSGQLTQLTHGEQLELWERIRPSTYEEGEAALNAPAMRKKLGFDVERLFEEMDAVSAVNAMIEVLKTPRFDGSRKKYPHSEYIIGREFKSAVHAVLSHLWSRGVLLYSAGLYDRLVDEAAETYASSIRPGSLSKVVMNANIFAPDIVRVAMSRYAAGERRNKNGDMSTGAYLPWFLLSSTVKNIGDVSPELLVATRGMELRSYKWWNEIRHAYEEEYGPTSFPQPPRSRLGGAIRTRTFNWVLKEDESLAEWVTLFEETIATDFRTYKAGEYTKGRFFFRWLLSKKGPKPAPETLSKFDIRDERPLPSGGQVSFREFLDNARAEVAHRLGQPLRAMTKVTAMRQLMRVMEAHRQKNLARIQADPTLIGSIRIDNPVTEQDCVWKAGVPKRTHRSAISSDAIEYAKQVLVDPDEHGNPRFSWAMDAKEFKRDWLIVDRVHAGKWPYEREINASQIAVWQPSRAIAIYTMLEIPLRTFQVRWLDSGAGDEYVWDLEAGRLVENSHCGSEPGRREGVFQPISDHLVEGVDSVGLYVTTNKTQQWNPEVHQGFIIPWPDQAFYRVLDIQRAWCGFVSNVYHTEPIKLSDDDLNVHDNVADLLPHYHVLFRDASNFAGGMRPISRAKIDAGWDLLCEEVQGQLENRGVHVRLVANRLGEQQRGKKRALHDLHSLRVSGITNLYLKGVPVEIISRYIAGHAAIAMTLHYEAADPVEIRHRLKAWMAGTRPDANGEKVAALVDLIDSDGPVPAEKLREVFGPEALERLFMANDFAGGPKIGLSGSQESGGSWAWYGDGVCPGARCSEGDESGGPVKGGPRSCGNCRFFLTGVAFLYGQAHKCNQLMFELRQIGAERERWYRKKRSLAEGSAQRHEAQARVDELDALIEPKLSDWWGRYQLLKRSLSAAASQQNAKGGGEPGKNLVARASDGAAISIERTQQFHLLRELSMSAEVLDAGHEAGAPVLELRAMINVLLSKYGAEPFLVGVPDQEGHRLTNIVAHALEQLFRAHYSCSATSAFERMQRIVDEVNPASDPILASSVRQLAGKLKSVEVRLTSPEVAEVPVLQDYSTKLLGEMP